VTHSSKHTTDLTFTVQVVPRASKSEVIGEHDGVLKVRLAAPPVDGAANRELIRVLAKCFNLPQNAVRIVSGLNSKRKVVRAHGAHADQLKELARVK
jgi:uncharacterized protein